MTHMRVRLGSQLFKNKQTNKQFNYTDDIPALVYDMFFSSNNSLKDLGVSLGRIVTFLSDIHN